MFSSWWNWNNRLIELNNSSKIPGSLWKDPLAITEQHLLVSKTKILISAIVKRVIINNKYRLKAENVFITEEL